MKIGAALTLLILFVGAHVRTFNTPDPDSIHRALRVLPVGPGIHLWSWGQWGRGINAGEELMGFSLHPEISTWYTFCT